MSGQRILALAVLAGVLLAAGCGKRPQPAPTPPPTSPSSPAKSGGNLAITDSHIKFPVTGPRVWEAEVGEITATGDPGVMKLAKVKCRLYRNGRQALIVEADRGDAVQQEKAIVVRLTDNIRATDLTHGLTMTADQFEWSSQYDRVSAVNVRFLGGGLSHRADRGVFSTDLTRATFTGCVTTRTVEE